MSPSGDSAAKNWRPTRIEAGELRCSSSRRIRPSTRVPFGNGTLPEVTALSSRPQSDHPPRIPRPRSAAPAAEQAQRLQVVLAESEILQLPPCLVLEVAYWRHLPKAIVLRLSWPSRLTIASSAADGSRRSSAPRRTRPYVTDWRASLQSRSDGISSACVSKRIISNDSWSAQNEPEYPVIADFPCTAKVYLLINKGIWKSNRCRALIARLETSVLHRRVPPKRP